MENEGMKERKRLEKSIPIRKWPTENEYAQILDAKSVSLFVLCDFQSFSDTFLRARSSLTPLANCPSLFIHLLWLCGVENLILNRFIALL